MTGKEYRPFKASTHIRQGGPGMEPLRRVVSPGFLLLCEDDRKAEVDLDL